MNTSINSANKNRKRGRPPVDTEAVNVRMARADIEAVDAFAAAQEDAPTRPEAVRRIVRAWLVEKGLLES